MVELVHIYIREVN